MTTELFLTVLEQSHCLIGGATGSGKSVLLRGILTTATQKGDCLLIVIDPKKVELSQFSALPVCISYADDCEQAFNSLEYALNILIKRFEMMKKQGLKIFNGCDVFIVVDELADLLLSEHGTEIKKDLQRLLALGRAARVHCILATQSPARKVLPAELVLNIPCRIALRCQTATESRQVLGVKGAESLAMFGTCLMVSPSNKLTMLKVPFTTQEQEQAAIKRNCELNKEFKIESNSSALITKNDENNNLIFWLVMLLCLIVAMF